MATYYEKLRDPRWQRKRLEIMERDEFACSWCGDGESTLSVHHGYYAKRRSPWEYEDLSLHTLCEECHKAAQDTLAKVHREVGLMHPEYLEALLPALEHLRLTCNFPDTMEALKALATYQPPGRVAT